MFHKKFVGFHFPYPLTNSDTNKAFFELPDSRLLVLPFKGKL